MATKKTTKKTTKKKPRDGGRIGGPASREPKPALRVSVEEVPKSPKTVSATAATLPAPCERVLSRDAVVEAVYLEALEQGVAPFDAIKTAEEVADRLRLGGPITADESRALFDLVHEQDFRYPGGKNKVKMRGNAPVMRDPKTIDSIVLHQTAIEFGVAKYMIAKADGDVELARARRALDVACHCMAFQKGFFVASHDLRVLVNHAGRFNLTSLGLEIEGRYSGLRDDPDTLPREDLQTTWGGNPSVLTDATVAASCNAIDFMVKGIRELGGEITRAVSHRQSSDARRSDPGEEIWQRVAIDHCEKKLGLELYLDSPWKQGRPVPTQWDPSGSGSY